MSPLLLIALSETAFGGAAGPNLTRYLLVVGVLIAAIIGCAFGFRRLLAGSLRARAAGRSLRVLDVLPLGGKQKLTVVRCYDRTFALGVGEKEVSLVAELDAVACEEPEQSDGDEREFTRMLRSARARLGAGARARSSELDEVRA